MLQATKLLKILKNRRTISAVSDFQHLINRDSIRFSKNPYTGVWKEWEQNGESQLEGEVVARLERQLKEGRRATWMASLWGPRSAKGGRCHMLIWFDLYFPRTWSAFLHQSFSLPPISIYVCQHSIINVIRKQGTTDPRAEFCLPNLLL